MTNTKTKKELRTKTLISILLLVFVFLSFLFSDKIESFLGLKTTYAKNETSSESLGDFKYSVSYIDVGHGNSTLVKLPDGKIVLIDAGNTMYGEVVYDYLCDFGVAKIDYLIATHADSDHIGGMNYLFDKFEILNIFRPFQIAGYGSSAATFVVNEYEDLSEVYKTYIDKTNNRSKISRVTSSIYNEFIKNIYTETFTDEEGEHKSKVTVFYDGLKVSGENYEIEFFAPLVRDTNDLSLTTNTYGYPTIGYGANNSNDNSAIFLLTCYDDKFLFTGDASWTDGEGSSKSDNFAELDFVNSLTNDELLKLDNISVYLAGHHGSSYSSSSKLLEVINPKFTVFSVGVGNSYGHPSSEVIFRIRKTKNLENDYLIRTDISGTIVFGKTGEKLVYCLEKNTYDKSLQLDWEMLSLLLYFIVEMFVLFYRPVGCNKVNFIDTETK